MAKILVVDDSESLLTLFERQLAAAGHEVTRAINGAKALRLLATAEFDLVITDVVMPDMEGLQLLRELRKLSSPPRAIAMSGGGRGSAAEYLDVAKAFGAAETWRSRSRKRRSMRLSRVC
jgi:CheY-like chemotaxis protein